MGGNVVSRSYKTANTTDLEVTNPDDSTFRDEKSQYATPNVTNASALSPTDTSIPLDGGGEGGGDGGEDTSCDQDMDGFAPWHGLPMGVDEHGSFAVINTDSPRNHAGGQSPTAAMTDGKGPDCCPGLRDRLGMACRPCLVQHNPLPPDPPQRARLRHALLCPPHGGVATALLAVSAALLLWAVLWAVTGADALPGGNLFALFVIVILAALGGRLIRIIHLPALLGMLIVGFLLRNLPGLRLTEALHPGWASALRSAALAVILIKAGLGVDAGALRRLSLVCGRLATVPCLLEAVTVALAARLLLGFGWDWAFMLGFVLAAVSPAVVVPSVLALQDKGYGTRKGVPTLIVAAASCENVFAIAAFGVALGISFSRGATDDDYAEGPLSPTDNSTDYPYMASVDDSDDGTGMLVLNIFRAPIELLLGVIYGVIGGVLLWYIPDKNQKSLTWKRALMVCGGGFFAVFGFAKADFTGAGAMGCLILAFVAAQGWGRAKEPVKKLVGILWTVFEPILFGLIGSAVSVEYLKGSIVGYGLVIVLLGLIVRTVTTFLTVCKAGLSRADKVFAALAWFPKATVQAAIGPLAWEVAVEKNAGPEAEQNGIKVLTLAVLSIIFTAPIGAILIALGGPRLLEKAPNEGARLPQHSPSVRVVLPADIGSRKEAEEEEPPHEGARPAQEEEGGPAETSSML